MTLNKNLLAHIEGETGEKITRSSSIGGGCIAATFRLDADSGKSLFLKTGFSNSMFRNEANSLRELDKPKAIRVPKVLIATQDLLLLEFIPSGPRKKDFFEAFGHQFAILHRHTNSCFGFFENNYIGATTQLNLPQGSEASSWPEFYWNKRLNYQLLLAEKNGYATPELRKAFHHLETNIETILSGSQEPPTLLHGDLWGGNYMTDTNGNPVLIDPAVYYGHREADLAMTRLFGGFSEAFYKSYQKSYPLPEGHESRLNIYLLYHVMNHLNLFGKGYYTQALQLAKSYK